jgi:hypothetical protein
MNEEIKLILKLLLDYITNLQEENRRLSKTTVDYDELLLEKINELLKTEEENEKLNKIIDELENYLKVGIAMNFNMNNNKFSEQTIDNYNNILNKLIELKKEVE